MNGIDATAWGAMLAVLALVGASLLSRWIEGWGVTATRAGRVRGPYGPVVSVRIASGKAVVRRRALFVRCLLVSTAVAALFALFALLAPGTPDLATAAPGASFFAMAAAMIAARKALGLRQAVLYGFAGYVLFGALLAPVALAGSAFGSENLIRYALLNLLPALATSIGIALAPRRLRFERTFEDGHVDAVWVSERSRAFAPLNELASARA